MPGSETHNWARDAGQAFSHRRLPRRDSPIPGFMDLSPFEFQSAARVLFGLNTIGRLGEVSLELGFKRSLLVADHGLQSSGHVDEALDSLKAAGVEAAPFHDFDVNPDACMVERGRRFAAEQRPDSIIGLGGGSSLDCAKGINFLLTNGGRMQDYRGYGKASRDMLPMIGIPTTAGTGSEAQSYALISDPDSHEKMACGDPKAAFRVVLLDPALTLSQPAQVTATAGFDAVSHAVESYVTTKRNAISECFSREAWRLLEAYYEKVLRDPEDLNARGGMLLGAYFAGLAIEHSMLGASHACANPLTSRHGITHGVAIAMLLPQVVRWNTPVVGSRYRELMQLARANGFERDDPLALALRLEEMAVCGRMPAGLRSVGVSREDLGQLAEAASLQWTGRFNPRPLDREGALEVYQWAF